jgi:hypothetical protein
LLSITAGWDVDGLFDVEVWADSSGRFLLLVVDFVIVSLAVVLFSSAAVPFVGCSFCGFSSAIAEGTGGFSGFFLPSLDAEAFLPADDGKLRRLRSSSVDESLYWSYILDIFGDFSFENG